MTTSPDMQETAGLSAGFAAALLQWWGVHGRKDLPWQQNPIAYRVWVSEIMLQQTQVKTVERYFDKFLQAFPDIFTLASADEDAVLHLWTGLGYYSRARNLHRAAREIADSHGGIFPADFDALLALPGIGRSTAGAILALSADQRFPILDGNAKRVLARFFGVEGWAGTSAVAKVLWGLADDCTPTERVANYTQAIMDLGAGLCRRSRPDCGSCPLQKNCSAHLSGRTKEIPMSKPKRDKPQRFTLLGMAIKDGNMVLLEKRPPAGIWGGLWSFPEFSDHDEVNGWCQQQLGVLPDTIKAWPTVKHSFSHFDLDMQPLEIRVTQSDNRVREGDRWLWYNTDAPAEVGLAAPVKKLLQDLKNQPAGVQQ
jgi:A/G-specific adenine glycosylase